MSGTFPRHGVRAAAAALAASALLVPVAHAAPSPAPAPEAPAARPTAVLLTDLQKAYRQVESATERYDETADALRRQRARTAELDRRLAAARRAAERGRDAAGQLARRQYQGVSGLSPYLRLLLARNAQAALDQEHLIQRASAERAGTVRRLAAGERRADRLAAAARRALARQQRLTDRSRDRRDTVRVRLGGVERMLAGLSDGQLAAMGRLERSATDTAQRRLTASGSLSGYRPPSRGGAAAVRWALRQVGKPYRWGAQGPAAFDCSGLTSEAWAHAGLGIPRTSGQQWARLTRVPLDRLRPGDLVVYFPHATHVALYLGNGMVVHAPRPGTRVKVSPVAANPVHGAVRPDPDGAGTTGWTPPVIPVSATTGSDLGYDRTARR
ncbi:C40 family peptidase [Streptomyces sp. NPDC058045]|uniref:C40 family peptidase n=1 Tax=Streptomyces sp. NPDC058045 TaxID=3346311 RepID=UPI0036EC6DD9